MREILFRGKRVDNREWVYGNLIRNEDASFISEKMPYSFIGYCEECDRPFPTLYKVDPETVCEYIGLEDKNGNKIFEGDIIKYTDEIIDKEKIAQIEYCEKQASFVRVYKSKMGLQYLYINERIANKSELIGNIFDNPELLTED